SSIVILFSVIGMILLGIGVKNADRTGTFNLFGRSYHLMQSEEMAPAINNEDMIVVKHTPATSFQQGDLVAFYQEQDGKDHLMVRRLLAADGTDFVLADEAGNQVMLSATDTRFLGTVGSKSAILGKAVLFLQSDDGKAMFLWWCFGILFFIIGITILAHVILKNKRLNEENQNVQVLEEDDFHLIDVDQPVHFDYDDRDFF
ncbi:MAG: S24/S26 family peptidase, partial [Oscillospiraceae bacterium]